MGKAGVSSGLSYGLDRNLPPSSLTYASCFYSVPPP